MLQYSLLLVEVVLLGATAYIYWNTRKLAENSNNQPAPLSQNGWQSQVSVSEMTQDVAKLVSELQAVAGSTRDDLLRQRADLQTTLQKAEALVVELRLLVHRAETVPAPVPQVPAVQFVAAPPQLQPQLPAQPAAPVAFEPLPLPAALPAAPVAPVVAPPVVAEPPAPAQPAQLPVLELAYSPNHFGEFLQLSGCGREVVALATGHAQEFMAWFTAQFGSKAAANNYIDPEYLGQYLDYMEKQQIDPDIIKRRFIALKAYLNWVNNISQLDAADAQPEPVAAPEPEAQPQLQPQPQFQPAQFNVITAAQPQTEREALLGPLPVEPEPVAEEQPRSGAERYRAVFSLAEQGLDQLAIAAKTGLEQEAVRMMLVMGRSAYAGL